MVKSMLISVVVCMVFAGCQTKSQTGALVGGLGGAGAGAAIGHAAGNTGVGAVIGGAVGAGGGYLVGKHMEKKDESRQGAGETVTDANTALIRVPNSDGSTTPITLKRQGGVWVGPRGETYNTLPTPEELRPRYGI